MLSLSTPWPELGWCWIISDVAYLAFIWGLWFSELYQTIVQGKRISPMHLPACSRRWLKVGFALGQKLNHAKEQLLQKCRQMKQEPNYQGRAEGGSRQKCFVWRVGATSNMKKPSNAMECRDDSEDRNQHKKTSYVTLKWNPSGHLGRSEGPVETWRTIKTEIAKWVKPGMN